VNDFAKLLNKLGLKIDHQLVLNQGEKVEFLPNLLGSLALVRFNKV
jgi:hypothetical protein